MSPTATRIDTCVTGSISKVMNEELPEAVIEKKRLRDSEISSAVIERKLLDLQKLHLASPAPNLSRFFAPKNHQIKIKTFTDIAVF